MRQISLGFLTLLVCLVVLVPASEAAEVRDIIIEGNHRIEKDVIREAMTSRVGGTFSEENLNSDLKAIYRLGFFDDVRLLHEVRPDGAVIRVLVRERPAIRAISYEGNKKVETEEIEKKVDIKLYSILDQKKLGDAVKKIKKLYEEEGYYLVDVRPHVKEVGPGEVEVTFDISENRKVRVRKIVFLGNQKMSDRKLRKSLATREGNFLSFITRAGTYDQELLNADVQRLIYLYHDNGFLDVKVSSPETYLSVDRKSLVLTFAISEGEAYRVGEVTISGDLLFPLEELKKGLTLKKGEIFRRSVLEKDIQGVSEKFSDEGYFYVNVRPIDHLQKDKRIVDIDLQIEKGLQVYFERINITGNTITRDKVIRRELKVFEGELFGVTKLRNSLEAVKRLGYFEDVSPATPRGTLDNQIDLNLEVKEKPTGTFSVGAGFSSVDKFIFNASVSKDNFLGLGLKGELSGQFGSTRKLYNISVTDPYFFDTRWLVGVSAFNAEVEFPDFDRKSLGGELQVGRPLWELLSGSITYRYEYVKITNVNPAVQSFFTDGATSSMLFGLVRDARDNRLFTKKGTYTGAFLEVAGGPFGGDNEYFKARFNTRFYHPIYKDIIFSAQATIGYIGTVTGQEVPIFERFFLGGINSLRGYQARSIGPTRQVSNLDPASGDYEFVVGGNKELVFNHEITFPLVPPVNIRGLVFFDAGNAYDDGQPLDITDMRASWGFGVRWYSPLGPLRFEFGFPINPRPNDKPSAFEFSIGSSF